MTGARARGAPSCALALSLALTVCSTGPESIAQPTHASASAPSTPPGSAMTVKSIPVCRETPSSTMRRFAIRADNPDASGKYLTGFIDETGRILIAPAFDAAKPFSEGLAAVKVDQKWGFIDEAGKLVVAPTWGDVGSFSNGRASVVFEKKDVPPDYETVLKCGFIDCAGATVIGPAWIKPPIGMSECPAFRDGVTTWAPYEEKLGPSSSQPHLIDVSGARVSSKALAPPGDTEKREPGALLYVHFYTRSISGVGPPPVMGYKNLAGKYVYLSQGIVEQKGEAWVRENYVGPANQSPLKKP